MASRHAKFYPSNGFADRSSDRSRPRKGLEWCCGEGWGRHPKPRRAGQGNWNRFLCAAFRHRSTLGASMCRAGKRLEFPQHPKPGMPISVELWRGCLECPRFTHSPARCNFMHDAGDDALHISTTWIEKFHPMSEPPNPCPSIRAKTIHIGGTVSASVYMQIIKLVFANRALTSDDAWEGAIRIIPHHERRKIMQLPRCARMVGNVCSTPAK